MDKYFSDIQKKSKDAVTEKPPDESKPPEKNALPKGVVLGKDGKP